MAEANLDFDGEDGVACNRFAASTPEPNMSMNQSPCCSPSLSTVYEFPLNGNIDRTIEIGSSGEQPSCMDDLQSDDTSGSDGLTFPSEDNAGDDSCSSDDGVLFCPIQRTTPIVRLRQAFHKESLLQTPTMSNWNSGTWELLWSVGVVRSNVYFRLHLRRSSRLEEG